MAYLAGELINRSWYLSGIVARDQETVPGNYTTEGLYLLNALLGFQSVDLALIPYYKRYEFNMESGVDEYFITGLYEIETMTFNIGPVRFPMTFFNRDKFFGEGRVDNVQSLPFSYFYERELDGSRLYVYYVPMQDYVTKISGKFGLTNVTLSTDLNTVYDDYYIEYLRYALAQQMCAEWDTTLSEQKTRILKRYEKVLQYVSPPDLTMKKVSYFSDGNAYNWALVNIPGWIP